ncbi:MAG TPA: metal-sulfur cluster assembly factor, partial [Actinomycetota bacterium]|nr:metal-sulfur cluster assembly factor [Actinomycetota bacterium]
MVPNDSEVQDRTDASEAPVADTGEGLEERVIDALRHVDDPELGINIVDLGLVYEVGIEGDTVHVTYTLTTMGCPIGPLIEQQIKQMIEPIEGIEHVEAEMVLS